MSLQKQKGEKTMQFAKLKLIHPAKDKTMCGTDQLP